MRLEKYFKNIQQDLKMFLFILFLLCLYRSYFMWYMSSYMGNGTETADILQALWAGLRLSLKTAGAVTLLSFAACTLPNVLFPKWENGWLRTAIGTAAAFVLAVLFQARFPYYREFGMTYGLQVVQGFHDDRTAIFWMAVQEYGLFWRLAVAAGLAALSWYVLKKWLKAGMLLCPRLFSAWGEGMGNSWKKTVLLSVLLAIVTFLFALFVRFGGSFDYAHGINWENAGVTKDGFLNECILDDVQALYRAKSMEEKMAGGNISGVDKEHVRELAEKLTGKACVASLTECLEKEAEGARIPKPRHIFIILGETYAQWPMLDRYEHLHAADGIRSLAQADCGYYTRAFLPNGDFTSVAITGLVTGLSEINIRVNYQPRSFQMSYPTAMAAQFKGLGYAVDFWYGGVPSWDNINRLAIAQGFDNFYGYPDYQAEKQNAWGTTDGQLFSALEKHLAEEPPTVHLVMTVSNHPPYDLDLAKEGFDMAGMKERTAKLPDVENAEELAVELGHYWYMDRVVTEFVKRTMENYPDSLFVITGDHGVRMNPSTKPTMFEQQSVPFVLYGQGVTKDILPSNAVGGHTNIVPTLVELIAPKGYRYHSIAKSMTQGTKAAFNRDVWITENVMGSVDADRMEYLPEAGTESMEDARLEVQEVLPAMRTLSWWLLEKGTELP